MTNVNFDQSWVLVLFLILFIPATIGIFALAEAEFFNPKETEVEYERGKIQNEKLDAQVQAEIELIQEETQAEVTRIHNDTAHEQQLNEIQEGHEETLARIREQLYLTRGLVFQITAALMVLILISGFSIRIARTSPAAGISRKLWTEEYKERRIQEARQNELLYRIQKIQQRQRKYREIFRGTLPGDLEDAINELDAFKVRQGETA